MKVKEISKYIETLAPLNYQESYDNAGLIVGDNNMEVSGVLIALDSTEEVIQEAIKKECNLVIAHHPIVFGGLKKLTGKNYVERTVIMAVKNDIAIYAAHTNLDSVIGGVNTKIADLLKLSNQQILDPVSNELLKLVTFVPKADADKVRNAICEAGAGHIGNYDFCTYNVQGEGTFRGGEEADPHVGKKGELHFEPEVRIETIIPKSLKSSVVSALLQSHPYEEVAYDLYALENIYKEVGIGVIGTLPEPIDEKVFLARIKEIFKTALVKHTQLLNKPIRKIAVCGGSGSFLLKKAMAAKADIFISGDFKYHEYFDADSKIVIADIGHFESEQFTKDVFYELLIKKFPNFAVCLSEVRTNPVYYF
jgi:dinuclear metal center YbgI/SA1388 family protein